MFEDKMTSGVNNKKKCSYFENLLFRDINDRSSYPEHNIFHQKSVDIAALNICFAYIE